MTRVREAGATEQSHAQNETNNRHTSADKVVETPQKFHTHQQLHTVKYIQCNAPPSTIFFRIWLIGNSLTKHCNDLAMRD